MNASTFDDLHGAEILFLAARICQACIPPRYLYIAMPQKQLQAFQAHAGIEQFTWQRYAEDCGLCSPYSAALFPSKYLVKVLRAIV
jgi:hypothetical protein